MSQTDKPVDRCRKRAESCIAERKESWDPHWRELSDFILPRRSRFLSTERNKGSKKNQNIVRGFATLCASRSQAGLMAGITSPARPWFRFTTKDRKLLANHAVLEWLHDVEDIVRDTINRAGLYNPINTFYGDLVTFGTGVVFIDEDDQNVVTGYSIPVGQYALGANAKGDVNYIVRELSFTAAQMVEKFGLEKCSSAVKEAYRQDNYKQAFDVFHVVEENTDYRHDRADVKGKRFLSRWFEKNADDDTFLLEGGYEEFPALCARWDVTGEDIYGHGPGMTALGDVKELQHHAKAKAKAIDKNIEPPMAIPASMRSQPVSLLPAAKNYVESTAPGHTIQPLYMVPYQAIQLIGAEIAELKDAIASAFYADLFLLFAESDRRQITAEEIRAKQDEKMLQIGPVFTRLDKEFLRPLIDRVFYALARRRLIPPPPPEMANGAFDVEYLNLMAQAQKLIQASGEREFIGFIGNAIAIVGPESKEAALIKDKLNWDEIVDSHAQTASVPPDFIKTDEQIAAERAAREQQEQMAQQAQMAAMAAKSAKDLSGANLDGDNMLSQMLGGPVPGVAGGAQ